MISIKQLAETRGDLTSIPTAYNFFTPNNDIHLPVVSDELYEDSIPTIDFSLLTSGTPEQRSKIVNDLGKACRDWGFFVVINHGVPESLMKVMIETCGEFFKLSEEEKQEYAGKDILDPIFYGTSINGAATQVLFWRDFIKFFVHPKFHCPTKPTGLGEISMEYCKRTGEVARELMKGISVSLGLEEGYIEKAMNLDSGLQFVAANLYPPCPKPDVAIGLPPHSDYGLLTLLIHNGVCGLQVQHKGNWVNLNPNPNAFVVNIGNHMEILSKGKYKSVFHRALVNETDARMSILVVHGPALETVVSPAPELVDNETNPPAFAGMKYREYLEMLQSKIHARLSPK
ncbi:2-oxoglutarate-dependent dioxygenase 19-like isoform X1 [Carya illinoinensis]|uniref:2-oxoglutarate-dependent dioxygenase 19-like isoform X1 n=1 Tax=Carya illinoinensis TaxID=32201 RepID=UPI001C718B22|nr:2-oxoglutarate-dependent dioxygenase 19-like isoform X1 [Carya illinoinensis]XP_042947663.1 2-oxoglutarate-dependent dioxygenase 19-like isoform X1 [Carya illinoinensis]